MGEGMDPNPPHTPGTPIPLRSICTARCDRSPSLDGERVLWAASDRLPIRSIIGSKSLVRVAPSGVRKLARRLIPRHAICLLLGGFDARHRGNALVLARSMSS